MTVTSPSTPTTAPASGVGTPTRDTWLRWGAAAVLVVGAALLLV